VDADGRWLGCGRAHPRGARRDGPGRSAGLRDCVEPDLVVNAAAYTQVDAAEDEASWRGVNARGRRGWRRPAGVAEASLVRSPPTTCSMPARRPISAEDAPHPLGVMCAPSGKGRGGAPATGTAPDRNAPPGCTRLMGAISSNDCTLAREQETTSVVADQHGCPTLAADLAARLLDGAGDGDGAPERLGHLSLLHGGETSWWLRVGRSSPARLTARIVSGGWSDRNVRASTAGSPAGVLGARPAPGRGLWSDPRPLAGCASRCPYAK